MNVKIFYLTLGCRLTKFKKSSKVAETISRYPHYLIFCLSSLNNLFICLKCRLKFILLRCILQSIILMSSCILRISFIHSNVLC